VSTSKAGIASASLPPLSARNVHPDARSACSYRADLGLSIARRMDCRLACLPDGRIGRFVWGNACSIGHAESRHPLAEEGGKRHTLRLSSDVRRIPRLGLSAVPAAAEKQ
jgi:hypothetical protein